MLQCHQRVIFGVDHGSKGAEVGDPDDKISSQVYGRQVVDADPHPCAFAYLRAHAEAEPCKFGREVSKQASLSASKRPRLPRKRSSAQPHATSGLPPMSTHNF